MVPARVRTKVMKHPPAEPGASTTPRARMGADPRACPWQEACLPAGRPPAPPGGTNAACVNPRHDEQARRTAAGYGRRVRENAWLRRFAPQPRHPSSSHATGLCGKDQSNGYSEKNVRKILDTTCEERWTLPHCCVIRRNAVSPLSYRPAPSPPTCQRATPMRKRSSSDPCPSPGRESPRFLHQSQAA